jgi:hypothetical protein
VLRKGRAKWIKWTDRKKRNALEEQINAKALESRIFSEIRSSSMDRKIRAIPTHRFIRNPAMCPNFQATRIFPVCRKIS